MMKALEIIIPAAIIIYFLVYIILALNCKKPVRTIFLTALIGIVSLALVNLTYKFTGVRIPINPCTVGVSAGGGVLGVVGILILNLIMGI